MRFGLYISPPPPRHAAHGCFTSFMPGAPLFIMMMTRLQRLRVSSPFLAGVPLAKDTDLSIDIKKYLGPMKVEEEDLLTFEWEAVGGWFFRT